MAHAAALALVIVVSVAIIGTRGVVTTDEGVYGIQSHLVAEGRWSYPYEFQDLDPSGSWFPYRNVTATEDSWFPYIAQPAHPAVLSLFNRLGGGWLLFVWPAAGAWAAALAAARIARPYGFTSERIALWGCGLSPLLVNASIIWAHAPLAAASGWALVLATDAATATVGRRRLVGLLGACLLAALSVQLRSEGLLIGVGLVVAWLVLARGTRERIGGALVLALASAASLLAKVAWTRSITGGEPVVALARTAGAGFIEGRVEGLWHALLEPVGGESTDGVAILARGTGLLALGLAVWAGLVLRRRGDSGVATVALLGAAACVLVRSVCAPIDLTTGLFPAAPALAFALVAVDWRKLDRKAMALSAFTGVVVVLVALTQYPDGGSVQWGGRFFAGVLVPMWALAAIGLPGVVGRPTRRSGHLALAVGVLVCASAVSSVAVTRGARQHDWDVVSCLTSVPARVIVTDKPFFPLGAWQLDRSWLLVGTEPEPVAADVADARGEPVAVLRARGDSIPPRAVDVTPPALAAVDGQVLVVPPNVRS